MAGSLWALFALSAVGSFAQPNVAPLDLHDSGSAEFVRAFTDAGHELIDPQTHPALLKKIRELSDITRGLWLPKDSSDPIRLVLFHSNDPNALFVRIPNSKTRVIAINTAMLDLLGTDSQLKFVLGHELEHGVAQLSEYVKSLDESKHSALYLQRLLAAEENEVDIKSMIYRLHQKSARADASVEVLRLLRKRYGNHLSGTHTTLASREATISMLITAMSRQKGEDLIAYPETSHAVADAKQFLASQEWKDLRRRKLEEWLREPIASFDGEFALMRDGKINRRKNPILDRVDQYSDRLTQLIRESGLNEQQAKSAADRLYGKLFDEMERSRVRVLGKPVDFEVAEDLLLHHDLTRRRWPEQVKGSGWGAYLQAVTRKLGDPATQQVFHSFFSHPRGQTGLFEASRLVKLDAESLSRRLLAEYKIRLKAAQTPKARHDLIERAQYFFSELRSELLGSGSQDIKRLPEWFKRDWKDYFDATRAHSTDYESVAKLLPAQRDETLFRSEPAGGDAIRSNSTLKLSHGGASLQTEQYSKFLSAAETESLLQKKIELLAAELDHSKWGFIEALDEVDNFFYHSTFDLLRKPTPAIKPHLQKLQEALARKLVESAKGAVSLPQAGLAIEIILPQFSPGSASTLGAGQKLKSFSEFLQHPEARALVADQVLFGSLQHHLGGAFPKQEDFYRFVAEQGDLIHRHTRGDTRGISTFFSDFLGKDRDRLAAAEWIVENSPENISAAAKIHGVRADQRPGLNRKIADYIQKELASLPRGASDDQVLQVLKKLQTNLRGLDTEVRVFESAVQTLEPVQRNRILVWYLKLNRQRGNKYGNWVEYDLERAFLSAAKKDPPEALAEVYLNQKYFGDPEPWKDDVLKKLQQAAKTDPSLKKKMLSPRVPRMFYLDEDRIAFSLWQLEERFPALFQSKPARPGEIRPGIQEVQRVINQQFENPGIFRDRLVNVVEKRLRSTSAESAVLSASRLQLENWVKTKELAYLDLPSAASRAVKTAQDRFSLVDYLLAPPSDRIPLFIQKLPNHELVKSAPYSIAKQDLKSFKARFREADVHARNYFLQTFLDHENGLLSDEKTADKLYQAILGKHYHEPVFREVFFSYLESVPTYERNVILGHILGSMVGKPQTGAAVADILSAMGPFGVKAGQFIKANGLGSPEILKELDQIFDQAMNPSRAQILEDIQKMFGAHAERILVGDLIGSGSINYVVRASYLHPDGTKTEMALRIQHENIEGRIRNEDRLWQRTIERLKNSGNPKLERLAGTLEEARAATMRTLKPGGSELDLRFDREKFFAATEAYRADASPATGFRIEVGAPVQGADHWVQPEFVGKADAYHFVGAVPLKEVKDPALREALARQIVDQELKAAFSGLTFDPDGHPGNWLVDLEDKRLVRIDYSQLYNAPGAEVEAFKSAFGKLVKTSRSKQDVELLVKALPSLLDYDGPAQALAEAIPHALTSPRFKHSELGIQRLFGIRDAIEEALEAKGLKATVRLNDTAKNLVSSLGKVQAYREFMNPGQFDRLMLDTFGIKKGDVALQAAKQKVSGWFKDTSSRVQVPFEKTFRFTGGTRCDFGAQLKAFFNRF